jgi:hypothetical protein
MRILITAAIVSALTGSAYCQSVNTSGGKPAVSFPLQDKPAEVDPQSAEHESAYKSAIEKIPAKKKSDDPWSGMRSSSGGQSQKSNR